MTTDEALKKELWAAIYESRDLNGHDRAPTSAVVAAVLPVIRKAQADALREAANAIDLEAIADEWSQGPGNSSDMHWSAGNAASTVQIRLFDRAREFEDVTP